MKNIIISFICTVFIFVFCVPVLAQNSEIINYNNELLGFSLSYPSDWYLEEHMEEEENDPYIGVSISFPGPDDYSVESNTHFAYAVMDIVKHGVSTIDELIIKANLNGLTGTVDVTTYFGVECHYIVIENEYSGGDFYILIKEDYGYLIGFSVTAVSKEEDIRLKAFVNNIFESIIIY